MFSTKLIQNNQPKRVYKAFRSLFFVAVAGASFISQSQAASRVFFDDFSSGSMNPAWQRDSTRNFPTIVSSARDGGAPLSGSYMMETNWNGVAAWNDPASFSSAILPSWNYTHEFLI